MKKLISSVVVSLGVLAACSPIGTERSGTETIDSSFHVTGFRWDTGGAVYIYAVARNKGGSTEVCAAYAHTQLSYYEDRFTDQTLEAVKLTSQGDTLVHGGNFINEFEDPETAEGKHANCVITSVPWKPGYADEIRSHTVGVAY